MKDIFLCNFFTRGVDELIEERSELFAVLWAPKGVVLTCVALEGRAAVPPHLLISSNIS